MYIIVGIMLALSIVSTGLGAVYEWNWKEDEAERLIADVCNRLRALREERIP